MGSESCFVGDCVPEAVVDVGDGEGYLLAASSEFVAMTGEFGREGVRERRERGEEGAEEGEEASEGAEERGLVEVAASIAKVARVTRSRWTRR